MNTKNSAFGTTSTATRSRSWLWVAGFMVVTIVLIYFWQVFVAALEFGKFHVSGYYVPRDGWTLPAHPVDRQGECIPVYKATRMTPYADGQGEMHRFPDFREHGNYWLLDSARTEMYEAELLRHPNCLPLLLQLSAAAKNRVILVIYDKATKSDLLVVRNY